MGAAVKIGDGDGGCPSGEEPGVLLYVGVGAVCVCVDVGAVLVLVCVRVLVSVLVAVEGCDAEAPAAIRTATKAARTIICGELDGWRLGQGAISCARLRCGCERCVVNREGMNVVDCERDNGSMSMSVPSPLPPPLLKTSFSEARVCGPFFCPFTGF